MALDVAQIREQLREALIARADRLGLDRDSIRVPSPGALVGRQPNGDLLRLDFHIYPPAELGR